MSTFRRRSILRALSCAAVGLVLLSCALSCDGVRVQQYYQKGALATASPIATQVGEYIFESGGNAFDVAVAVGFTLAVVHPEAGNIGGGGFAVVRVGETGEVRALDFREIAPAAAEETMYLDRAGEVREGLSTLGALAAGVPGTVAGLHELWESHGTLPWADLVNVAAASADSGFIVDAYLSESLAENREELSVFEESSALFYPGGTVPEVGSRLVFGGLATTLYRIAAEGVDGFYRGPVAEAIVKTMSQHGGIITLADLEAYRPQWRDPIRFTFDGLDIYSMPPPSSGGIALGQILKLLEPFDLTSFSPHSPEYIHLFSEASRLAFADRSEHLGDPDFYDVPDELLSDDYLKSRRNLIDEDHASSSADITPGQFLTAESEQTTHFSVCDGFGNMVSITYTLNAAYGCKLVVGKEGFLLNNEMDDFSVKPGVPNLYGLVGGEANRIESGKRMLSSMSPTLVLKEGRPYLALGAPGGSKIITTVAQTLLNISRFGLGLGEAVANPRFHHQWLPDQIYLEEGTFDINVQQDLIRFGHTVQERSAYSDVQIVLIDPDGLMLGASDPRNRGSAGGL